MASETKDPFENLPRRGLFVDVPRKVIVVTEPQTIEMAELQNPKSFDPVKPATSQPKPKRGRPKSSAEPWKAAGVSKATWFRKKKSAK